MNVDTIRKAIEPLVQARGCFIVEIEIENSDEVTLCIESKEGTVTMDDCEALSLAFEDLFDREVEDYALTVTSAGLDRPFKVEGQFEKAIGSEVEVLLKGGRKLKGVLRSFTGTSIDLEYSAMELLEGRKRKTKVEKTETFPMEEVNSVRPYIKF